MEKIEIRDLLKICFIENLQYSPDGKTPAFVLAKANEEKNDYERDVWLLKEDGPVPLLPAERAGSWAGTMRKRF